MPPTATEEVIENAQNGTPEGLRNRKNGAIEDENTPQFSWKEVAQHNSLDDIWIIYNGSVYDVTRKWFSPSFIALHGIVLRRPPLKCHSGGYGAEK